MISLRLLTLALLAWPLPTLAADPGQDAHGDPLPPGAVARLGTTRLQHPGPVIGATFVKGGRQLLVSFFPPADLEGDGGGQPVMRLWSVADGALVREIASPPAPLAPPRATPDGGTVVCLDPLGRPREIDVDAGRFGAPVALQGISGLTELAPVAGPDGPLLLAANGQEVGLWTWPEGARVRTFDLGGTWPGLVAVSDDGKRGAVAVGRRGDVALLDLGVSAPARVLPGDGHEIVGLSLSPDGGSVAIADASGRLRVHAFEGTRRFDPIEGGPAMFSADSSKLLVGVQASLRAAHTGALITPLLPRWSGLTRVLARGAAVALLVDQRQVVLVDADGAPLHPALTSGTSKTAEGYGDFLPDGRLVTWGRSAGISIWSPTGRLERAGLHALDLYGATPLSGDRLAVHHRPDLDPPGPRLSVYALSDFSALAHYRLRPNQRAQLVPDPRGRRVHILSRRADDPLWRVDPRNGASGRQEKSKGLWSGACHGPEGLFAAVVSSPAPGWRKTPSASVYLWKNVKRSGKRIILEVAGRLPAGRSPGLDSCGFSPDGRTLRVAGPNGVYTINVRWAKRRRESLTLTDPLILTTAIHPGGQLVATGDGAGAVRLRRIEDGALVSTFEGHHDLVHHLRFSPDGEALLSMSADRTGLVWRVTPP